MDRLSDDCELLGVFERDIGWRGLFRCSFSQAAEGRATTAGGVDDKPFFSVASLRIDIPALRRSGDQHETRHRSHFAEAFVFGGSRGAAARHLNAVNAVIVCRVDGGWF